MVKLKSLMVTLVKSDGDRALQVCPEIGMVTQLLQITIKAILNEDPLIVLE